jgi:2-polyprenyl-3-methyl-5-hydroxy-6-metoxy-1,4-benzoquinol methylase
MINDATLGPAAPEYGWVPAPRYLLRRALILRELRAVPPCDVLEIGPGPGMLLHELDARGFHCHALEMSDAARETGRALAQETGRDIRFLASPAEDWPGRFGLVMAFEVLEHIEHDAAALREWRRWLKPNGTLLLSVPSHMKKWNPSDVWAGHFRRYERTQLLDLMDAAGFVVENLVCYGYPLANIIERMRAHRLANAVNANGESGVAAMRANSARSGTDRSYLMRWYPLLKNPLGKLAIRGAVWTQRPFLRSDLGNGYLLRARPA